MIKCPCKSYATIDAIVIPANPPAQVGGGTESSIYEAAGVDKLLAARQKVGELQPGDVAATEAFNLPAKILIHAVSAVWSGGGDETKILRDCYRKSLELAREKNCRSIAFPLLGTGNNRVPKEKALLAAVATIESFLSVNEMEVYLVIFGQRTFELVATFFDVHEFIDESTEKKILRHEYGERINLPKNVFAKYLDENILRDVLNVWGQDFKPEINRFVDASGLSNKEIYTRAGVRKKVFYDAINFKGVRPTKRILLALIVVLKIPLVDALKLLARAEYFLSSTDAADSIVGDFLREKVFDVDAINDALEEKNLQLIGSK